jgi:hypothetical protein
MKDVIGSVFLIISLISGGNYALRKVHDQVRKAALTKAAKGMPSLVKMTKALRGESVKK